MAKSVAIVGGGPAGLVAAKTLLHHPGSFKFNVTVFEAAERVGGMWRGLPGEKGAKCSPEMRTNLSRYTVSFSDLAWSSADLSDPVAGSRFSGSLPMFPKAWQVGRYLETYAKKFLPDNVVRVNRRVTAADLVGNPQIWKVTSVDRLTQDESTESFDYLIVASGFFDQPAQPILQREFADSKRLSTIQHSSQFRDVASFTSKPGNILVIGGGISGAEAAATAAFQLSNAKHSPAKEKPSWADSVVYHVMSRPFYCLPRYLPQNSYNPAIQGHNLSPCFLPLDLIMYNLGRRGEGPIHASNGLMPAEKATKAHEFIRSLIGGDQRDTGREELVYKPNVTQYPAFTAISDTYMDFVRSGLIVPVTGRVGSIVPRADQSSSQDCYSTEVVAEGIFADEITSHHVVNDVVGIIEATGYQVHLDYLSNQVKERLDYDPRCSRVPLLFSPGSIFNPNVPNLAFIGFYEGPYWAVMEMQARLVAQAWDDLSEKEARVQDVDMSQSLSVREAVKNGAPEVPQFWMADYVGLTDEFARLTGVERHDSSFDGRQKGPAFPARYCATQSDEEALSVIREVATTLQDSEQSAKFVAVAAFRAMQGGWVLQRKIDSRHTAMPGGTFKGKAHFHPRIPTADAYTAEYLYIEEGSLTMDNGLSFAASRRYVYRYKESTDTITAWFVEEDGLTTSTPFNTWEFYAPEDTYHGWLAKGHHWCSPDTYKNNCEFRFRGINLETFGITYEVSGPKKDYSHESWYSRPSTADP
ncbi:hypothetical protein DM02DRAFT_395380 [Periconia macrospinosa]|uniref:Uncharacterized protein n=1 Tax=Periconia macrospinosa TaxID=97972 RepID=A0A2V1DQF7_9PLEO|nr:hypothetical protein DM02DRAFT_395380 [Periconia macrospinosa]